MKRMEAALACASMVVATLTSPLAQAVSVPSQGSWKQTLQPRDIDRDGRVDAYYDTTLNITWMANANVLAGTERDTFDQSSASDGRMSFGDAWAPLRPMLGLQGWRLPQLSTVTGLRAEDYGPESVPALRFSYTGGTDVGYNVRTVSADGATVYSELAHLFHVTLGNDGRFLPDGTDLGLGAGPDFRLQNTGPFEAMQPWMYWSYRLVDPELGFGASLMASVFDFSGGVQRVFLLDRQDRSEFHALYLRDGDIPGAAMAVPEAGTGWLAAAGLLLLGARVRRRARP